MKRNVSQILIVSFISLCFIIIASSSVYALSPFGQILINSDSPVANSTTVTLTLNAADPALGCIQAFPSMCGVSEMSFSNDGINWSTPEPATTSKDWTLLPGDGNKTVYVQFRDEAENWSGILSDSIVLDTAALTTTIWTWGRNDYGQLGDGTTNNKLNPFQLYAYGFDAIAAGGMHAAVIKSDGTVWTWGFNRYGQLGDGTLTDKLMPVPVSGLDNITSIAASCNQTAALKSDGTVWTWGLNQYGQLGDGTTSDSPIPVRVSGIDNVVSIAAGCDHTMALRNDGTVWSWGYNAHGQLGDGTTLNKLTPVPVSGLTEIIAIKTNSLHSAALKSDGTVWTWGYNYNGELGDGTTINRSIPVRMTGVENIVAISCGGDHTMALNANGKVWGCGHNLYGQLGDGTTVTRLTPVQTIGLDNVVSVYAGYRHTTALKSDGTVWSWGYNFYGELGDGTTATRNTPVQATGIDNVIAIASGNYYSIALSTSGLPAVAINAGNEFTTAQSVAISLICPNAGDNCSQMQFSSDNLNWSDPEVFAGSKEWTLAAGDGPKTVYVKFQESAGSWSDVYSDSIILDATASVITASPMSGTYYSPITVSLSCDDQLGSGCGKIYYSRNGLPFMTYTIPLIITSTTTLQFYNVDKAGNSSGVSALTYAIAHDTWPPTGSIWIDGGAASSNTTSVTLILDAHDTNPGLICTLQFPGMCGVTEMKFSNDGVSWTTPEPARTSKSWTLLPGNGTKTVYVQFKDNAGNWSGPISDSIILNIITPPDLIVYSLAVPATGSAGSTINVTDTTKNKAIGDASVSVTSFYLSANPALDAGDTLLGSRSVPALGAGLSDTGVTPVTLPSGLAAGTYYIIAKADGPGAVTETIETNNTRSGIIKVGPDLMIASLTVPSIAGAGSTINFTETTKNNASGDVPASVTNFYLSTNSVFDTGDTLLGSRSVPSLGAGLSDTGATAVTLPSGLATGTYYIIAKADGPNAITETIETNNTRPGVIRIGPDLMIASLTVPSIAGAGSTINVTETAKNNASGDAPASVTNFYLSTNSVFDTGDTLLGSRSVPALGAGLSDTGATAVTLPSGLATGTYYLIAKADGPGAIAETIETNNTRSGIIRVGPDLMNSYLSTSGIPKSGGVIIITNTTKNIGGGATVFSSTTSYFLSSNTTLDSGDVLLGSRPVNPLSFGQSDTGPSMPVTIPAETAPGTYYLIVKTDADGVIAETSEINNTYLRAIAVQK